MSHSLPYPKCHPSGQSFVALDKKTRTAFDQTKRFHYFGKYGTPHADQRYWQWRAKLAGHPMPAQAKMGCLVPELFDRYREAHPDDTASRAKRSSLKVLKDSIGALAMLTADEYGPLAFQQHRQNLLSTGTRCARQVNDLMQLCQRVFRWGVSRQLVRLDTWQALKTVDRLKPHHSPKQTKRRKPVPASVIAATLPHLSPHCQDMVKLIVATGARPGEILSLQASEIVRSYQARPGWWYAEKTRHKTSNRGKKRWVEFPPEVQSILEARWPEDGGYFFPVLCPRKGTSLHYQVSSLRQHIRHVCEAQKLPYWGGSYVLRHTKLTDVAGKEGLEAAARTAGHSGRDVILQYVHEPPRQASWA